MQSPILKALTSGGGASRATSSLTGLTEDKEVPSASAGTAFSASSEEVEGAVASTEKATGPLASNDEEASSKAESQSVDKESLKQAYARLQSLLQQDFALSDKTADSVASYRQARLEAESLEQ